MFSILGEVEAMQKLGTQIRAARLRRNISQEHLASLVGISVPTFRKIEAGDGTIEFRHVAKTIAILGHASAISDLVPDGPPDVRIKDLIAPERKKASSPRKIK